MSYATPVRRFASQTASIVFRCLHGGLLSTGVAVSIAAAALLSTGQFENIRVVSQDDESAVNAELFQAEARQSAERPAQAVLTERMRAVVDYVARRYRVAVAPVEEVVRRAQAEGQAAGLDPLLVVAVIGVESRFNPVSESVMGAQGLMQVVGKYHADKLEAAAPSGMQSLLDPATNIRVGVQILKESIRQAGSLEAGLQQYAGAPDDPELTYAGKVLAEKQRLEQAARRRKMTS